MSWLDAGMKPYQGRDAAFNRLSSYHYGAWWVRTPALIPWNQVNGRLILAEDAEVLIGLDSRAGSIPRWLGSYENTGEEVRITFRGECVQKVYSKYFTAGDTVMLGPNGTSGKDSLPVYSIAIRQRTGLAEAIDLRPVRTFRAENSDLRGQAKITRAGNRTAVVIEHPGDGIQWEFRVGLASLYALEFRYMNRGNKDVPLEVMLLGEDATVCWQGSLHFYRTGDRWQSLRTDTRTMINAGTYRLVLTQTEEAEICFDWLRIQ